ncbi:MAG: ABC transporter permease [Anaerolineae bacterium]|nr:ABC transporter permease [Gemmatimonadaceae bacterium]
MRRFIARRLLASVAIVFLAATFTFILIHLAPGDPFSAAAENSRITPEIQAQWRAAYALDRPLPEQYFRYIANTAKGDFGYSFSQHRSVGAALADAIPNTLLLMGVALIASFAIGIVLGALQARARGTALDRTLGGVSLFFYSMPDFWVALVMLLIFSVWLGLLPSGGMTDPLMYDYWGFGRRMQDRALHLVLPVASFTLLVSAAVARYQRSAMLDMADQDFVRTARAKGATERRVVVKHILRNALLPIITLLGLAFPLLLGGSVFIERIFSWPGMGRLAADAILTRDYPLVMAVVIIGSVLVSAGNLLADVLYAFADPRLRRS